MTECKIIHLFNALLCGQGEIYKFHEQSNQLVLVAELSYMQVNYVQEYIGSHLFENMIRFKNNEMTIHSKDLIHFYNKWYQNNRKILPSTFDLSLESIILCINLCGKRHLDGISVSTSLESQHLPLISAVFEKKLLIQVATINDTLKFTDTGKLTTYLCKHTTIEHLIPFMSFFSKQEIKRYRNDISKDGVTLL